MSAKFCISILTYTALQHAKACISSVFGGGGDFELILTANGNIEAAKYFQELALVNSNIRIVQNAKNEGFIDPNKHALSLCESQFFVMLNDDAIVPVGWLSALEEPFIRDSKAALSGARGGCFSLHTDFHGHMNGHTVEYIEGSCLCCKTEIVKRHGLFDPELKFCYGEDSNLSLRMRQLGYSIHMTGMSLIRHERGATSRHVQSEVQKYQVGNHEHNKRRFAHYLKVRKFGYPIVVKRNAALGDVLLTTPVIRALKRDNPGSPIYVETIAPEIFERNPYVTKAGQRIPIAHDTLVIDLNGSYEANPGKHFVETYAEKASVSLENTMTEIFPSGGDCEYAERTITDDKWIAIHPGPNTWPGKEWTVEGWREMIAALQSQGYRVVLTGMNPNMGIVGDMDLRGRTTVHNLSAIISKCRLMISIDSFPMHAAQAVGTPVVGLFGVTLPQYILTSGSPSIGVCADPSHPCAGHRHKVKGQTYTPCGSNPMLTITPAMVLEAARKLLVQEAQFV